MGKFVFTPNKASEIQESYDAIIIGAGGAGLTAAFRLMN